MTTRTASVVGPGRSLSFKEVLASDVPSSVVVFLVALPLCMGIALASGAPIMAGLISGIVGGLVAGLLGGAPLLVSGPAAGLAVMVFGMIADLGFAVTCAAVVVAGLIQVALGSLRVARYALAISPAVIHGMLAGIGIVIVAGQVHIVLGGSPQSNFWTNLQALPAQLAALDGAALLLGLVTLAVMIGWQWLPDGRLKKLPAPLVAVGGATVIALLWDPDVARVRLAGDLFASLQLPQLPAAEGWVAFAVAAVSLAIVASAESLLSAVATDKLHGGPRANLDRELVAQGLANTTAGLVGGLPITWVIVRSATNIAAGARTRWSAVLHAVWLLAFLTLFGAAVERVPLAVLAALLIHVGAKLVNPAHIRELRLRGELLVYVVTVAGVVGINLLAGIGLGLGVAILRLLWRLGTVRIHVHRAGEVHQVRIGGTLTFVGVPALSRALAEVPPGAPVEVELDLHTLDHSGYEALHSWAQTHRRTGGQVRMEPLEELWSRRGAEVTPSALSSHPTLLSGGIQ